MKNPWIKWFPSDWRADVAVRSCSLAARGLWIEMLGMMHEAEPYGHLIIGQASPTVATLAMLVSRPEPEVAVALAELAAAGVFSRNDSGVIFSRRMLRDRKRSEQFTEYGRLGGSPILRDNPRDKPSRARVSEAQKPEAQTLPSEEKRPRGKPRLPIQDEVKGTSLDRPDFLEAMESWESSHGRYKAAGLRAQLHRLGEWGPDRSVAAIRYSLAQGFQGIYEDKGSNGHQNGQIPSHKPSSSPRPAQAAYLYVGSPEWKKAQGQT